MEKVIKKLLSFMLIVSMLMSISVKTLAAETPKVLSNINSYSSDIFLPVEENIKKWQMIYLIKTLVILLAVMEK